MSHSTHPHEPLMSDSRTILPGREGKGREQGRGREVVRVQQASTVTYVTREPRHGLTIAGDDNA